MTDRDRKRRNNWFIPSAPAEEPVVAENWLENGSFEFGVGEATVSGPGTYDVVDLGAGAHHGTKVARLTATGSGTITLRLKRIPILPEHIGQYCVAYGQYWWRSATAVKPCRLNVHFLDALGAGVTGGVNAGTQFNPNAGWTWVQNNDNLIPADTAFAEIRAIANNVVLGDVLDVDSLFAVVGENIPNEGPHPEFSPHPSEV